VIAKCGHSLEKLRIFVGVDSHEELAYKVCRHSLLKHATVSLKTIPLKLQNLMKQGIYTQPRGPTESTEFSFTRCFLLVLRAGHCSSTVIFCTRLICGSWWSLLMTSMLSCVCTMTTTWTIVKFYKLSILSLQELDFEQWFSIIVRIQRTSS
jgi:hypothetical protein